MSKPGDKVQKKWKLLEELGDLEATMLGGGMTVRDRLSGATKPMELFKHAELLIERLTLGIENGLPFPRDWLPLARATTRQEAARLVTEDWEPLVREEGNGKQFLFTALSVLGPQGRDGFRFLAEYGVESEVIPQGHLRDLPLQLGDLLVTWIHRRRLRPTLFRRCAGSQLAPIPRLSPGRQVGREQPLTPKQRSNFAEPLAGLGLLHDLAFVLDGERPSSGLLGHLGHLAERRYRGRGHSGIPARPAQ